MRARRPKPFPPPAGSKLRGPALIPNRPAWGTRVYAICFDLDTEMLKERYHNASWQNGYQDIARVLARHGFDRQQGSVYFGNDQVDPVRCVLAIQDVARECPWFRAVVSDVRMLRIEENNDLMPALES
jgi:virulence-associated protein VapD